MCQYVQVEGDLRKHFLTDRAERSTLTILKNVMDFGCCLSQRYTNDVETFQVVNSDLLKGGFRVNTASFNSALYM